MRTIRRSSRKRKRWTKRRKGGTISVSTTFPTERINALAFFAENKKYRKKLKEIVNRCCSIGNFTELIKFFIDDYKTSKKNKSLLMGFYADKSYFFTGANLFHVLCYDWDSSNLKNYVLFLDSTMSREKIHKNCTKSFNQACMKILENLFEYIKENIAILPQQLYLDLETLLNEKCTEHGYMSKTEFLPIDLISKHKKINEIRILQQYLSNIQQYLNEQKSIKSFPLDPPSEPKQEVEGKEPARSNTSLVNPSEGKLSQERLPEGQPSEGQPSEGKLPEGRLPDSLRKNTSLRNFSEGRLSEGRPSEERPSEERPSEERPSEERPSEERPSEGRLPEGRPSEGKLPASLRKSTSSSSFRK